MIANGTKPDVLPKILGGKPVGTLIVPPRRILKFHKVWIAFSARRPAGTVVVDAGAVEALLRRGKSLQARGVKARLLWFPDENHWVQKPRNSRLWYQEVIAWLQSHGAARQRPS